MSMGLAGVERGRRRVATLASGVEGAEKRPPSFFTDKELFVNTEETQRKLLVWQNIFIWL